MTAVEKFIEQLEAKGESWENVSIGRIQISINVEDYLKLIEQAKEMEKEQIIEAFAKGSDEESDYHGFQFITEDKAIQYYNETFKTNK